MIGAGLHRCVLQHASLPSGPAVRCCCNRFEALALGRRASFNRLFAVSRPAWWAFKSSRSLGIRGLERVRILDHELHRVLRRGGIHGHVALSRCQNLSSLLSRVHHASRMVFSRGQRPPSGAGPVVGPACEPQRSTRWLGVACSALARAVLGLGPCPKRPVRRRFRRATLPT